MLPKPKIVPLGDSSILVQFGKEIDLSINRRVHALANLLDALPFEGMIETVPAYTSLLVQYDPLVVSFTKAKILLIEKTSQIDETISRKPKQIEVPVRYGGKFGIDLDAVARHLHLRVEDVVRLHTQGTYTVFMMGFTPGFPYMGKLDDALIMPRLETPRTHVPAGTVAVAGSQTGIYPITSPGGWQLIGWTSLQLFDPHSETPFLFAPGDEVKFYEERP